MFGGTFTQNQKGKTKKWSKIPRDQVETIHGVVASTPAVVSCMLHDKAKLFAKNIMINQPHQTSDQELVESELWTRFSKEFWQQLRRYGIAVWDVVWSTVWKRPLPVCYDLHALKLVSFFEHPKTRERRWHLVDSRGNPLPSTAGVVEWQRPETDGTLTSDMAMLILAVLTHDMRRVQANRAVAEASRTPVVFESQLVMDKAASNTHSNQLGLMSFDAAEAMTQSREYPQNSVDATLRLRDILVGVDSPAAPIGIDLLSSPGGSDSESEPPLRATWLVKPGFHLVPQPFAQPYVPDMKLATEMLENEVGQIMGVSRIYWSEGTVLDRSEAAERLAHERSEMRQREMQLFLMRHLENMYMAVHSKREAFSLAMNGLQSSLSMPPSLTIEQIEMLRRHKILTSSELREHVCDMFGITMSSAAKREAKASDESETALPNAPEPLADEETSSPKEQTTVKTKRKRKDKTEKEDTEVEEADNKPKRQKKSLAIASKKEKG
jgi:hypothetical protein